MIISEFLNDKNLGNTIETVFGVNKNDNKETGVTHSLVKYFIDWPKISGSILSLFGTTSVFMLPVNFIF